MPWRKSSRESGDDPEPAVVIQHLASVPGRAFRGAV
jgi:hypothetical protein